KEPDAVPTEAEFNQKIILHIKDLGDWWTLMKERGLTEEKSVEAFISRLVLIIDGVPLKHLQPSDVGSYSPNYPYHSTAPDDPLEADKAWRSWLIGNALREAENKPTFESVEHVTSRAGVEADLGFADRARKKVQEVTKKVAAANATNADKDALIEATKAQLTATQLAAKTARQLSESDFKAIGYALAAFDDLRKAATRSDNSTATERSAADSARRLADLKLAEAKLARLIKDAGDSATTASKAVADWALVGGTSAATEVKAVADKQTDLTNLVESLGAAVDTQADLAIPPPRLPAGKAGRYHHMLFQLVRRDEDQNAWMEILRPDKVRPELKRRCRISVAFERKDGAVQEMVSWVRPPNIQTTKEDVGSMFSLVAMPDRMLVLFGAVFVFALAVLILAGKSGLLREHDAPPRPDGAPPYSLARCQMALWFFLISLAFVFLWQMLGRKDTVNNTAVILLGISSFTAVGSALITKNGGPPPLSRRQLLEKCGTMEAPLAELRRELERLKNEKAAAASALNGLLEGRQQLTGRLAELEAKAPDRDPAVADDDQRAVAEKLTALRAREQEILTKGNEIAELKKKIESTSACIAAQEADNADVRERLVYAGPLGIPGFFKDLLRDGDQHLSIARFQMMVWTLVLAVVFTVEVYWHLAMPEFNPALLALLGITSGTYLGFKGATQTSSEKAR
ncbi:MAG TPA: hypothetical protein VGO11_15470, partial [Chthoniobacteraceae bacterium]|nr:hypothetical protein [Chthoniobacteraceae bacterium]